MSDGLSEIAEADRQRADAAELALARLGEAYEYLRGEVRQLELLVRPGSSAWHKIKAMLGESI